MSFEILKDAHARIRAAREIQPWYAGDFSPVRTDQISELLVGLRCRVETFPFQSGHVAMTAPPTHYPEHVQPIFINRSAARIDQRFALRHEVGHVLAGEGGVFMTDSGFMADHERAADLFALADLVPGRLIRYMRRQRAPWCAVLEEVRGAIELYAGDWPVERLLDRAELRVDLFRKHAL